MEAASRPKSKFIEIYVNRRHKSLREVIQYDINYCRIYFDVISCTAIEQIYDRLDGNQGQLFCASEQTTEIILHI